MDIEISLEASFNIILCREPIAKVLIRLHRYAGRSAPLLSPCNTVSFSCVETNIFQMLYLTFYHMTLRLGVK